MTSTARDADRPGRLPAHIVVEREAAPAGELRLRIALSDFDIAARSLRDAGARFVTLFLADTPERSLVGAFALGGELLVLRAPAGEDEPVRHLRMGDWWRAARWTVEELEERQGGEGRRG